MVRAGVGEPGAGCRPVCADGGRAWLLRLLEIGANACDQQEAADDDGEHRRFGYASPDPGTPMKHGDPRSTAPTERCDLVDGGTVRRLRGGVRPWGPLRLLLH